MKLGEALTERAALQGRIGLLRERVRSNAVTQEGETPSESAQDLVVELETVTRTLEGMVVKINLTNASSTLEDGRTLTEALAHRDALASLRATYMSAADAAESSAGGFFRRAASELKQERHLDAGDLHKRADETAQELRGLDAQIQAKNWVTELVG